MRPTHLSKYFREHPASVGETYWQHMAAASSFGAEMLFAGFACLVHGVFPFLFVRTGSDAVKRLHRRMAEQRDRRRRSSGKLISDE